MKSVHFSQFKQDEENDTTIPAAEYAEASNMPELTALLKNQRPKSVQRKSSQEKQEETKNQNTKEEVKEETDKDKEDVQQNTEDEHV